MERSLKQPSFRLFCGAFGHNFTVQTIQGLGFIGFDIFHIQDLAVWFDILWKWTFIRASLKSDLNLGHSEPAHTQMRHEGWMVSGQETVFHWVSVPQLSMVVSSVAFFFPTSLLTTHLWFISRQVVKSALTYVQTIYLTSSYLFSYLSTYI